MIKGILFDLNGTLIDIATDEYGDDVYRTTAGFLRYSGVDIAPELLRERYFSLNREQRRRSQEAFPEFDAVRIFHDIILEFSAAGETDSRRIALGAAQVFRASGCRKLQLYPGVFETLEYLRNRYYLSALSDGQSAWAQPEMRAVGLEKFFHQLTVSGDLGFRKPDRRIFEYALRAMKMSPDEVIFVGNDMYRDIYGGREAGMRTVFFRSNQGDQSTRLAEADYIIYEFPELLRALEFFGG